ncbi:MAG: hypothetical protein CHACPFDD_02178 [Phycisphaerae bacterium]|nr:hypothetical protein [Phycisphaerae bacterium]
MRRVLTIARQTFWEGVHTRVVLVSIIVLLIVLPRLPFALRGDETLTGKLQNFLSYSLGALSVFASLATVFFSCSTLAAEFRNNILHMTVTKPVSRFQILAGKWLGVNLLNVVIVAICSMMIYAFAFYIARQPKSFERDRLATRDTVWTARVAAEPVKPDFSQAVAAYLQSRVQQGAFPPDSPAAAVAAAEKASSLENDWRRVSPGTYEIYRFDGLAAPEGPDTVVQVRFRARGIPYPKGDGLPIWWLFVDAESGEPLMPAPTMTSGRTGDLHQFLVTAPRVIKNGKAALVVLNYDPEGTPGDVDIAFEGKDALQILYKINTFETNFLKNVGLLLFRLAFLSAVGLFFGVFVSFPIACLCTFSVYLLGLAHDWWMESIGANIQVYAVEVDPYGRFGPFVRLVLQPLLTLFVPNFTKFGGTAQLVAGEDIGWSLLGMAALHTVLFGAVVLLLLGWWIFREREIAQVTV